MLLRKNTVAVRSVHRSASSSLIVAADKQHPKPTFANACGRRCFSKASRRSIGATGPPSEAVAAVARSAGRIRFIVMAYQQLAMASSSGGVDARKAAAGSSVEHRRVSRDCT